MFLRFRKPTPQRTTPHFSDKPNLCSALLYSSPSSPSAPSSSLDINQLATPDKLSWYVARYCCIYPISLYGSCRQVLHVRPLVGLYPGLVFPMLVGSAQAQWDDEIVGIFQALDVKYVLGFNEPDNVAQSNLSPAEAAALWQQHIQPLKRSRPAASFGRCVVLKTYYMSIPKCLTAICHIISQLAHRLHRLCNISQRYHAQTPFVHPFEHLLPFAQSFSPSRVSITDASAVGRPCEPCDTGFPTTAYVYGRASAARPARH